MPDELPIITANITIANVKDVPYARNDGTQAVFKSLGHKNADGTWLNLSCFDELIFPLIVKGNTLTVGYTEKWATLANGQPKLYNGVQTVYRTIMSAELLSGSAAQTTSPQNGPLPAPKAYDPGLGAYQTALNCATQMHAALIEAKVEKKLEVADVIATAEAFHTYLVGDDKDVMDLLLGKAKETLGAEVDPDYEAARDAQESLGDDSIPF
jgi:hypothetical protein